MPFALEVPKVATRMRTGRAAVLHGPGEMRMGTMPLPVPAAHQILVRIESCGVCGSNLGPWKGAPWFTYPFAPGAPGHEGVGFVQDAGDNVVGFEPGDRVAFLGHQSFAEFEVVDAGAAVRLPRCLNRRDFPGEPLACAMNVFARAGIGHGQTVAIVGIGFLGALLVQLCHRAGANVIAFARRPFARNMAERFGAHALEIAPVQEAVEAVRDLAGGNLCDAVIEATGKAGPLELAGELTRERGKLVIAGYHQDGPRMINMQLWNWRGLDVINAHERETSVYMNGMQRALTAVLEDGLEVTPLITHRLPLDRLGEALDLTRDRPDGFLKALVFP